MKIAASSSLSGKANTIKSCNENILKDINELSSVTESMLSFWEGDDATSFVRKINDEYIPKLNKAYDSLDDYAVYLSKVYSVFKSVDEYYDKEIDV